MGASSKGNSPRLKNESDLSDQIGNHSWIETACITSYGVTIGVRVNRKGTLDRIRPHLPPTSKESRARTVQRLYSIVIRDEVRRGKRRRVNVIYADDELVAETPKLEQALDAFESDLQLFVAETAPGRVFVHAGVVAVKGKAIVIPGRSFSGKTSLVAELVRAGATYYSDEYAVLDERGIVHHYARPLGIRENGHLKRPRKYTVEALGGRSGNKPLQVGLVVVSKYKAGARWRPRRLTEGEGALELMANTVSARRQPRAMLEAIRGVVSLAPVLKGARGEAREVVQFIFAEMDKRQSHLY